MQTVKISEEYRNIVLSCNVLRSHLYNIIWMEMLFQYHKTLQSSIISI